MKTSASAVSKPRSKKTKARGRGRKPRKATGAETSTQPKAGASDLQVAPIKVREAMDGPCPYCSRKVCTIPDIRLIDGEPVKIGRICHECGNLRPGGKRKHTYTGKRGNMTLKFGWDTWRRGVKMKSNW